MAGWFAILGFMGCRSKPCSECRRWFLPDPRVGSRARTCGRSDCQGRRRARTNRRWRAAHPEYDHARRLTAKLALAAVEDEVPVAAEPAEMGRIGWDVVQAEMGTKPAVIIQDLVRVALLSVQAEIEAQVADMKHEFVRLALRGPQAETDKVEPKEHHPP